MQLRTKALIIVTVVIALLFLVMYVAAQVIIVGGSGDLQSRVWYFLLLSFAIGLAVAFGAVFLIEKIGISLVYNMGEAIRRIRDENDLSVGYPWRAKTRCPSSPRRSTRRWTRWRPPGGSSRRARESTAAWSRVSTI